MGIGKRDVSPDGGDGDRKRLAVKIADGDSGADQDSDSPAKRLSGMGYAHLLRNDSNVTTPGF